MKRTNGSALISAIMVLVLLSTLAGFLVHFASTQQMESGLDVRGSQALYAARAGAEWGLYRARISSSCVPGGTVARPWTDPTPASWPSFAVEGFTVTVLCESSAADENGVVLTFFRITATACSQPDTTNNRCPNNTPGEGYIERQWQATTVQ